MPAKRRHLDNPNYASVKCMQPMPGMVELSNSDDSEGISATHDVPQEMMESIVHESHDNCLLKPLIHKNQISPNFNQNSNNDSEPKQDDTENKKSDPEAGGDGAAKKGRII